MGTRLIRLAARVLPLLAGYGLVGQPLDRVDNTTLTLPTSPPVIAYQWETAFQEFDSFDSPVAIVTPDERIFVVEKPGRIWVIKNLEDPVRSVFLSLTDRTASRFQEQGLLGLAFHPSYDENRQIFVFYTATGTGEPNRLSRFTIDPDDPDRVLPDSEEMLFSQHDDDSNHNGGDLHFGPDGYLYVSLGDEGASDDFWDNSQRIDKDFFAGILRIDVDKQSGNLEPNPHPAIQLDDAGKARYSVPSDNPWVGVQEFDGSRIDPDKLRTEFYAVGLRNPWRMAFDSDTGLLYAGDVGQGAREEINLIEAGGNYGWSYLEGTLTGPRQGPAPADVVPPLLEYPNGTGSGQGRSVIGGIVYHGSSLPALSGAYVFADYVSGHTWSLRHQDGRSVQWDNPTQRSGISAFGEDPRNGDILAADFNSNQILRLVDGGSGDPLPLTLSATGAFRDLGALDPHPGIVPYSINAPFWSDGAFKTRWFALPDAEGRMGFSREGQWTFPAGAVWIKHFELELEKGNPASRRRLETRFIVHEDGADQVYGITYRWDENGREARLVPEGGMDEEFEIREEGTLRRQVWHYPGRSECLGCHTEASGGVLGFKTAQLNRMQNYAGGTANQIRALALAGYLDGAPQEVEDLPRAAAIGEGGRALEVRVRSYLDTNCSQCHQPGGTAIGLWDARLETPLGEAGIVDGSLTNPSLHPERRVVVPGDVSSSELYLRMASTGTDRMPSIATNQPDQEALELRRSPAGSPNCPVPLSSRWNATRPGVSAPTPIRWSGA